LSKNKKEFVDAKLFLNDEVILKVAHATIGQSKNYHWITYRKHRLTCSKFGSIINAHQRNKFTISLLKSLNNEYNFSGIHAIEWGLNNEKNCVKSVGTN